MYRLYRMPALSDAETDRIRRDAEERSGRNLPALLSEWCYYVVSRAPLSSEEEATLQWLVGETFRPQNSAPQSFLSEVQTVIEVGPQLNFETPWSSAAVAICRACGLASVTRFERSIRYGFVSLSLTTEEEQAFVSPLFDRMVQMVYPTPPVSFESGRTTEPVRTVPLLEQGEPALWQISRELGFGWDEQDVVLIVHLYAEILKRDPTDVELIQLAQANSEHSRHWFFKGRLVIDGVPCPDTLMDIVKRPWRVNPNNSLIAFHDDSSAIRGGEASILLPLHPGRSSPYRRISRLMHPTLTAETHNHPTLWAAYEGAGTGTGGRIRDNQVTGRGALVVAGGAAYCTGNLHIPGYDLPWENDGWQQPSHMKSPLEVMIGASNGASDYGNCFGEPVIVGFIRTAGLVLPDGYHGWLKPIMYSAGTGLISDDHTRKGKPEPGMLVVQLGGPAYRIGLGGGAASSMISGDNTADLDFDSVQRPSPEMENRLNRFFRACVALGPENPIVTSHDLGAGGDCNAVPEIVDPAGARISLRAIPVGDQSLSTLVIWGNESQERDVVLIWPDRLDLVTRICERESLPMAVIGTVTGDGHLVLVDEVDETNPVDLPLDQVLGELPPKTFHLETVLNERTPLSLPANLTVGQALDRVLRLSSVGSKRFLTTKVDRSVTGRIAQQQCVGPNQLTLSDYAVIAQTLCEATAGTAMSLGEQPMKGMVSPEAMARLAVAEAVLNLAGAVVSNLRNIRCSANWMLAAKLPGEGSWLYRAAEAMAQFMIELGMAVDGGKDSLSMAVKTTAPDGSDAIVKAPGELVIAAYVDMPDVRRKVTPEFKNSGDYIVWVDLSSGEYPLGGSALAQVYGQIGKDCPDIEAGRLQRAFQTLQLLVKARLVDAVHDISDGGLVTTLLEMAFAGNLGFTVRLPDNDPLQLLFSETPGLVVTCSSDQWAAVRSVLRDTNLRVHLIGRVWPERVVIQQKGVQLLDSEMTELRRTWECTSTAIDRLQADPACVDEEADVNVSLVAPPPYRFSFAARPAEPAILGAKGKPRVAILREQGSNGDEEMAAAFYEAGFDPWDVTMTDLVGGRIALDGFRGVVFVGGFSFADVLDAGKGWAGVIRFNKRVAEQFRRFYERSDTFSLGVCNGCQLMALLGWVPGWPLQYAEQPRFIRNRSSRFESRFSTVEIRPSPAIMFRDMHWSRLGIWVAHGEGRLQASEQIVTRLIDSQLVPLRLIDDKGQPTERYPFNPNGSPGGVTAICSPDGRHLAMMPHPERTWLTWQWPWMPESWRSDLTVSPWLRMFQNAHSWCR